jgi:hypothetical protein
MTRLFNAGKALWSAYCNSVLWFTLGAVLASVNAFIILTAIYHAGRCR